MGLHQETWTWTDEAKAVGFHAQIPQVGSLYLITEVAEVFEAWLRENTDAVRRNNKKFDMAKELCDVAMMSFLSVPRNVTIRLRDVPKRFTIQDILHYANAVVELWAVCDDVYANRVDHDDWQLSYMSWLDDLSWEAHNCAYTAFKLLEAMQLDPVAEYRKHLAERYKMMSDKQKRESRWIHRSRLAEYIGQRVSQLQGSRSVTMDEAAILYMAEELKRNGKIMSQVAGQQAIAVPDSDCVEVYEMYGALLEREADLIEALKSIGFSGRLEDIPGWLRNQPAGQHVV